MRFRIKKSYMYNKVFLFVSLYFLLIACSSEQTPKDKNQDSTAVLQRQKPIADLKSADAPNLRDFLNTNDNFSLFASYLNTTLSDMLGGEESYTIFVPTNKALESLGEAKMTKFLQQGAKFVKGHIVKGKFDVAKLKQSQEISTLNGNKIKITVEGDNISIGKAKIVAADINAKNGVIQAIDGILE